MDQVLRWKMKRIWKNYNLWEDYKAGMYSNEKQEDLVLEIVNFFNDEKLFLEACFYILQNWSNCIDHNLSYASSNRQSYLGQAACAYKFNANIKTTTKAWLLLSKEKQDYANSVADLIISIYEKYYYIEPKEVLNEKLS